MELKRPEIILLSCFFYLTLSLRRRSNVVENENSFRLHSGECITFKTSELPLVQ